MFLFCRLVRFKHTLSISHQGVFQLACTKDGFISSLRVTVSEFDGYTGTPTSIYWSCLSFFPSSCTSFVIVPSLLGISYLLMALKFWRLCVFLVTIVCPGLVFAKHQGLRRAVHPDGQGPMCDSKYGQPSREGCAQALTLMSTDMTSALTFGYGKATNDIQLPLTFSRCMAFFLLQSKSANDQLKQWIALFR